MLQPGSMKLRSSASIAASLLLAVGTLFAGTRPHYGGTLRVQSRDSLTSADNIWMAPNSVLAQQLTNALFDRLVEIDANGQVRPSLAVAWKSDAQQRVWEFEIRPNVKLSDGNDLSMKMIAASLSKASIHWKVKAPTQHSITVETEAPSPDLLNLLSLPQNSIASTGDDKSMIGTGPFRLETFQAARRIVLAATDDYWGGRPYLDRVEITMGGSVREQLINRRVDPDDVVELSPDQARTIGYGAQQINAGIPVQRIAVSSPGDLYALVFFSAGAAPSPPTAASRTPVDDPRLREAIALTIDRVAISRVLLQKEDEAASSLLPQWMTGYAFLFDAPPDLEHARKLRNEAFHNAMVSIPLAYDSGDNVARAIAERIAVNAREANISLQVFGEKNLTLDTARNTSAQAVLVRMPLSSNSPAAALFDLGLRAETGRNEVSSASGAPETLFAVEHEMLAGFRIVPVAHVQQIYWLNPQVHDWTVPRAGGWRLSDVWVEPARASSSSAATTR
jgi:ABC-type transport system substrate-binding protein